MRISAYITPLIGILLLGCADNSLSDLLSTGGPPDNPVNTVTVEGDALKYRIFVPKEPSEEPMPLLLAFHGGGGRNDAFPQQSQFEQLADQENVVVAYPLAELQSGNEGEWELNTDATSRDIQFVQAVIDDVSAKHPIDANRVYATGYSLGSMFTYELVCQLSDRIAAVASFAGSMPITQRDCAPQRSVSIMHIHDRGDSIIPYGNTWDWKAWPSVGTMHDIPGLVATWKDRYNCQDRSESQSGSTLHLVWDDCDGGARVEHYRLDSTDHFWPDSIGGTSTSTHRVIWNFVSEFSLTE